MLFVPFIVRNLDNEVQGRGVVLLSLESTLKYSQREIWGICDRTGAFDDYYQ